MSERPASAAPVVDAALWRAAFVLVLGTFMATVGTTAGLDVLPALLDADIDRLLGELW